MLLWGLLFSRLYLICGICWWPREWLWAVHQGAGRHPPPCMDIKRVQPGAVGPQRVPPHLHPQVHHYHPCKVHKKGATWGTWTTTTPTPMIRSTHSNCIKWEQLSAAGLGRQSLLLFTQTDQVHQKNCIRCSHWSRIVGMVKWRRRVQLRAIMEELCSTLTIMNLCQRHICC